MYGDTEVIRHLATQLSDQASEVRERAEAMLRTAEAVVWDGRAAEAMRRRMADRAVELRVTAARHDEAAAALLRHAQEVDDRKERIEQVAARLAALVEGARSRLAALADRALDLVKDVVPDPADELLARFVPPPPGHLDWLRVPERLPGVGR